MIISASSFALMNLLVKQMEVFSSFQLVFFRAFFALIICYTLLIYLRIPIWGNQKYLLVSRGIVGTFSLIFFFMALKIMPIGTAVSLRYVAPFFGIILAIKFLNEKMMPIQWLFIFIAFCGAALIKGFDARISTYGLAIVMSSAFFSGVVYLLLRKLGKDDHPVVIVFYFMLIAAVIGLVGSIDHWVQPIGYQWIMALAIGILGFFGQYFMTKAFQIEETNKVAPLKYIEAVMAMLLAWIWLGEGYNAYTLLGIVLVILGVLLNTLIKAKKTT